MNGKDLIATILVESSVIPDKYTGQVILHLGDGTICDVECVDRKKRLATLLDKKVLDIFQISGKKMK